MKQVIVLKSRTKHNLHIEYRKKSNKLLLSLVNRNNKTIIKNKSYIDILPETIHYSNNGIDWTIADHSGHVLYKQNFSFCHSPMIMDSDRYILYDEKRSFSLKDLYGNNILPFNFEVVLDWNRKSISVIKSGKAGVYSSDGFEILPPCYDDIRILGENLFEVIIDNERALFQKNQGFVTDFDDFIFTPFHGGIGGYSHHGDEWGLIDSAGNMANVPELEDLEYLDDGYFIFSFEKRRWGVIDERQHVLIPPVFSWINSLGNGYIGLKKESKSGVVNTEGKRVLHFLFSYIESYDGKNFLCGDNSGFQFYDESGDLIFKDHYTDARPFMNGIALVYIGNRKFLLNEYGEMLFAGKTQNRLQHLFR